MNQCVPSWNLDNGSPHHLIPPPASSLMSDYEVAELRWENGQLEMHGHRVGGASRSVVKPPLGFKEAPATVASWEKPRASGTLEAVVNQAIRIAVVPVSEPAGPNGAAGAHDIVPCLLSKNPYGRHLLSACPSVVPPGPAAADALVPCPNLRVHGGGDEIPVPDSAGGPTDGVGTCVGSCSVRKRANRRGASDANCSVTGSAASRELTFDTGDVGFATSASPIHDSPETENANRRRPLTHADRHDSVHHSRRIKKHGGRDEEKTKGDVRSVSSKRSRAAAVHNQSERKRRDRINQKMKTLQKLVPNSNKTDKASILDEAIDYMKQLQAQVQVMSRMGSVPPMMMPNMAMQHMQMAVMAQMAQMSQTGMGMGMMNMNSFGRAEQSGGAVSPTATLMLPPPGSWDIPGAERLQTPPGSVLPADPFAQLMACQNQQPNTAAVDAYGRMAALYRQLYQQQPGPNQKTQQA